MKVEYKPENEFSDEACKAATGKNLKQWYAALDAQGGPATGRRALGVYLSQEQKVNAWWSTTLLVEYEKAKGLTEKDGHPQGYNICVTKTVAAAPGQVYDALADTKWWLGGKAELKDGGAFNDGHGHQGSFKKLTPGKVMRFTWEGKGHQPGEKVEIKLTASGAKTSIALIHDCLGDRAAADGMRAAWTKVLDTLKERFA